MAAARAGQATAGITGIIFETTHRSKGRKYFGNFKPAAIRTGGPGYFRLFANQQFKLFLAFLTIKFVERHIIVIIKYKLLMIKSEMHSYGK